MFTFLIIFDLSECLVMTDLNARNKILTDKLPHQGYRYHKIQKAFSKFYRLYYELVLQFKVGLKFLSQQGLSEPDFYGDLIYELRKMLVGLIFVEFACGKE